MTHNADTYHTSGEIDLRELARTLWYSKIMIIAVTLAVTCIGAAYAFLSSPIYQTTVQTLPPTASGLASYNVASQLTGNAIRGTVSDTAPGIEPLTPQQAYRAFLRHLNSTTIRQKFFNEYYLPAQEKNETEGDKQRAWKQLDKELTIELPEKTEEYEAGIVLEGNNPQLIAKWANAYISLAVEAASEDLLSSLAGEVEIRKLSLEDQIITLRKVAERVRLDRIIRLKGASEIAENIGIISPTDSTALITINPQGLNTENINSGSLLYLRGTKALQSEIRELEQRKSNDAYISELPDLLKKQALLESIKLAPDLLSVATIDQAAIVPEEPVKPRKGLVLALSIMLGTLLGSILALAWSAALTRPQLSDSQRV